MLARPPGNFNCFIVFVILQNGLQYLRKKPGLRLRNSGYGCRRVQFGRNAGESDFQAAREAGLVCNLFYPDEAREAMSYFEKGADVILTNCAHQLISDGIPGRRSPTRPLR